MKRTLENDGSSSNLDNKRFKINIDHEQELVEKELMELEEVSEQGMNKISKAKVQEKREIDAKILKQTQEFEEKALRQSEEFEAQVRKDDEEIETKKEEIKKQKVYSHVAKSLSGKNRIKLDIGGKIYVTSISTLTSQKSSFFTDMFSEQTQTKPEQDGSYFIDREAGDFDIILNRLRGEDVSKRINKLDEKRKEKLKNDVDFYLLKNTFVRYFPRQFKDVCDVTISDNVGKFLQLQDGRIAYLCKSTNSIKVWDGKEEKTLIADGCEKTTTMTQLQDGTLAGNYLGLIKIWDLSNGRCIMTLSDLDLGYVSSIIQLQDGRIASGGYDIEIWDKSSGQCVMTLTGHEGCINSIIQLQDGRIASAGVDKTIKVWDTNSKSCVLTLVGHVASIYSIIQLQDGRIASGSFEAIKIWDINNGECVMTLILGHEHAYSVIQLHDGRIASGGDSENKGIRIWDVNTEQCVSCIGGESPVNQVTQLQDGRLACRELNRKGYFLKILS
ncbi:hypothetical protein AKO1_005914 [Acrasis kona]|uniref:Potassium channel tetramerisation-type BTB domain-containing protein n=1 Tax=Acrasis kona TaxID=1008807 RepID=A0AAW2YJF9_9EUKA